MFGGRFGPFHAGVCDPSASPRMSHCPWLLPWPAQMMSHENPPQLLPPDFRSTPNGPPAIPFEFNDRAVARSNSSVWLDDMWPYLARSHSTMLCGLLETQGPPGPGPGPGVGVGATTTTGDRNVCVPAHELSVSPSLARARQNSWMSLGRSAVRVKDVCPDPSSTTPAARSPENAWPVETWNS